MRITWVVLHRICTAETIWGMRNSVFQNSVHFRSNWQIQGQITDKTLKWKTISEVIRQVFWCTQYYLEVIWWITEQHIHTMVMLPATMWVGVKKNWSKLEIWRMTSKFQTGLNSQLADAIYPGLFPINIKWDTSHDNNKAVITYMLWILAKSTPVNSSLPQTCHHPASPSKENGNIVPMPTLLLYTVAIRTTVACIIAIEVHINHWIFH